MAATARSSKFSSSQPPPNSTLKANDVGSHLGLRISNFAPKKPSNVRICLVDILTFDGLASSLELQAGPSRIGATSSSPPIVGHRIYEKVGGSNSQIKWLQQAILSN